MTVVSSHTLIISAFVLSVAYLYSTLIWNSVVVIITNKNRIMVLKPILYMVGIFIFAETFDITNDPVIVAIIDKTIDLIWMATYVVGIFGAIKAFVGIWFMLKDKDNFKNYMGEFIFMPIGFILVIFSLLILYTIVYL